MVFSEELKYVLGKTVSLPFCRKSIDKRLFFEKPQVCKVYAGNFRKFRCILRWKEMY